jgi:hypothetical protein
MKLRKLSWLCQFYHYREFATIHYFLEYADKLETIKGFHYWHIVSLLKSACEIQRSFLCSEITKRHFVIIRSSCATASETMRESCCGRETSTAMTVSRKSLHRRWNVTSTKGCVSSCGSTLPLQNGAKRQSDEKNRESIFILRVESYFWVVNRCLGVSKLKLRDGLGYLRGFQSG